MHVRHAGQHVAEQLFFGQVTMGGPGRPEEGHPVHLCPVVQLRMSEAGPGVLRFPMARRRWWRGHSARPWPSSHRQGEVQRLIGSAICAPWTCSLTAAEQVDKVGRQLLEKVLEWAVMRWRSCSGCGRWPKKITNEELLEGTGGLHPGRAGTGGLGGLSLPEKSAGLAWGPGCRKTRA